jgi:L-rhamnonate dehydratase
MEITDVYTVSIDVPTPETDAEPRREPWLADARVANPMSRYPRYAEVRASWTPDFEQFGVVVEAEDGTTGFAVGDHGAPVAAVIDGYLGERVVGESAMAVEKVHDMLERMCAPFGAAGLASYAVSAIDLALWDLKGKILERPVYELLGGPAHEELTCYATGNDTDWYLECGFEATKLACPYGPADGREGLGKTVDLVADRRDLAGEDVELMLDCWMAFDEEYTVRLANELRPYDLKWIEEYLPPEELEAHESVRERLPWQTLATGEHWYTPTRFHDAASRRLVDVFQPDVMWVGGLTSLVKVCNVAEAAGITVVPHAGGNSPYGQHACYALPAIPWTEFFVGTPPGVPLEAGRWLPGQPVPEDGTMVPSDDPGFGVMTDEIEFGERPYAG